MMTVLTWFADPDRHRDVAMLSGGRGTLVLNAPSSWSSKDRIVEFNGHVIGSAQTRFGAEEVLYEWARGVWREVQ